MCGFKNHHEAETCSLTRGSLVYNTEVVQDAKTSGPISRITPGLKGCPDPASEMLRKCAGLSLA